MKKARSEAGAEYRANLYITRRCDIQCWYCSVPLTDAAKRDELDAAAWRTIVDRLDEMGVKLIVNMGGEPFLRQDLLLDSIPYQIEKGIYPVLLTNGRLITKSKRARDTLRTLAAAGLESLTVSVDMAGADAAAKEGSVSKSATGLAALEFAESLGMKDLIIATVIDKHNPQAALELFEENSGRYRVMPQMVVDVGGMFSQNKSPDAIRQAPLSDEMREASSQIQTKGDDWGILGTNHYWSALEDGAAAGWKCWLPGHVVVSPRGGVQLCSDVYGAMHGELNLLDTPLRGDALLAEYEAKWYENLEKFCPSCFLRCHVDFHVNATGSLRQDIKLV